MVRQRFRNEKYPQARSKHRHYCHEPSQTVDRYESAQNKEINQEVQKVRKSGSLFSFVLARAKAPASDREGAESS